MDSSIEHLTQRVTKGFRSLTTPSTTSESHGIRLQDLEVLSDRFNTWCTNIVSQPYGCTTQHRRLEDAPELLDALQEALRNIDEDLVEVQSYQENGQNSIEKDRVGMIDPLRDDSSEHSEHNEKALRMILEDLDEAITSLMRLTKPLNDYYLLGAQSHVEDTSRSDFRLNVLSALEESFPRTPDFILNRLARSMGERRRELLEEISHLHAVPVSGHGDELLRDVYNSVKSVLEGRSDRDSESLDGITPDGGSISSIATNDSNETERTTCQLCLQDVAYGNESMLRKHYQKDLGVYVCVLEECPLPHVRYGTRTAWAEHLRSQHGRIWRCPFGCEDTFDSKQVFDAHMLDQHHGKFDKAELPTLAEICEKHTLPHSETSCPFCKATADNARAHYRHVARHLEDLAPLLFQPLSDGNREHGSILLLHDAHPRDPRLSDISSLSQSRRDIEAERATSTIPRPTGSVSDDHRAADSEYSRATSKSEESASESDWSEEPHQEDQLSSLDPACAICGAPAFPECAHEGERLLIALNQAQEKWAGVQRIRDWVLNSARNHIISTFERERGRRQDAHLKSLKALPYYSLYQHHEGHPPLPSQKLQVLQGQLRTADANLKNQVDTAWRNACLMYPRALEYFFQLVSIKFPSSDDEKFKRPKLIQQKWYESRALQSASNPFAPSHGRTPIPALHSDSGWPLPQSNDPFSPTPSTHNPFTPPGSSYQPRFHNSGPSSVIPGFEPGPSPYGYPSMTSMSPYMAPPVASPPPPPPDTVEGRLHAEEARKKEKTDAMMQEVEKLRALIQKQEEERIAREKAIEAAELAKKMKAEADALKAYEIAAATAAATAAAKKEAERAAKAAAKRVKEENEKVLAEVEAARLKSERKDESMMKELEAIRDLMRRQEVARMGASKRLRLPKWVKV